MSDPTYKIEYSKTGRSKCKNSKCKDIIDKGQLRVGKQYSSDRFTDGGTAMDWFHAKCIFDSQKRARKTTKKVDDIDDLEGFDDIKDPDKILVKTYFKEQKDSLLKKKPASKSKSKSKPKSSPAKKPSSSTWVVDDNSDNEKKNSDEDDDSFSQYKFAGKNNNNNDNSNKQNKHTTTTTTTTTTSNIHHNSLIKKKVTLKSILSPKWLEILENTIISNSEYDSFINGTISTLPKKSHDIFLALNSVLEPKDCKVVVIGQAPFRERDSASGFSYCDDNSKHWQLNCKVSTKNMIKQGMISKGFANKDDDINTLREILSEIDLPGDSPKDWFKSTAKQGVLWLNTSLTCTEDQESITEHAQFWAPVVEEVIRSIFTAYIEDSSQASSQNPIPGVVFVLFGKSLGSFKTKIENINSEIMNAVPIEIIEGQSPILESFNSYDYFNQINKILRKFNQTEIDWWKPKPEKSDESSDEENEEEENITDSNNNDNSELNNSSLPITTPTKTNKPNSTPKKNYNPNDYECFLVREDSVKFQVESGSEITIGRKNLDIQDLAISRRHANVEFINTKNEHYLKLTPTGSHPMHLLLPGTDKTDVLENHKPAHLNNDQQFLLCNQKYQFTVEIINKNNISEVMHFTPRVSGGSGVFEDFEDFEDKLVTKDEGQSSGKRKLDEDGPTTDMKTSSSQNNNNSSQSSTQKPKLSNSSQQPTTKKPTPPSKPSKPAAKKKKSGPKDKDLDFDDDFVVDDSDDDYNSEGGNSDSDDDPYVSIPTRQNDKPDCKYWDLCYRKNPQHLADFRHP